MGQEFADAVHVHHRLLVGIIDRGLNLVLANLLTHQAGELIVDRMSWTCGDDSSLDGLADERHITDDVEQLVACALIVPLQGLVLDIAQISSVAMLHVQHVCQHVETLLRGLTLVDHNGIVEVATLDEIRLKQRLDVANEYEGTCRGNLRGIFPGIIEGCKLRTDKLRLKGAHRRDGEVLVGQDGDDRTSIVVFHLNLLSDDIPVLRGILLFDAHLFDLIHILDSRSVEDGELRAVHLNHTVVNAQRIEGRETVLNGRDAGITLAENGATLSIHHILCNGVNNGFTLQVDSLNLVTSILRGWVKCHSQVQTCMQSFTK